jgi:hypothetical protein
VFKAAHIRFMIALADALKIIRQHDYRDGNGSFGVVFLTCNRTDRTGGELIELTEACGCGLPPTCKDHDMIGIKDMQTGKPYAVHNKLLFQINKQEIYWV